MSNPTTGAHILVFPFPAQGHMLPLLDLTHQLSVHGLTITLLITPKNLPICTPLLSKHPQIQTLILPFPSHPSIPPGAENVRDIGNQGNIPITDALSQLTDPIIHWFKSHPSPPIAILSDFFLGWTQQLAVQLSIPRIAFYTSGAFLASVFDHLFRNVRMLQGLDTVTFPHLPNSPSFPYAHLPSLFRRYNDSNPSHRVVKDGMVANMSSYGIIFNTLDALESVYLDHVSEEFGHTRIWSVGPISLFGMESMDGEAPVERGGPSSVSAADVFNWLDGCPNGSVIYVCFGSQVMLTKLQLETLTAGLEESGTRFILAVKEQKDGENRVISSGFENRTAGRGMVIKGWAPQVPILSHRAVGGFLTHCGWNSVLEGIVAGVLLFAWPMEADQFVNAKLLVEDMGVGVKVCEGADSVPDPGVLARSISGLVDEMGTQKVKAMELREKALSAVREGGSSMKDFHGLVEELGGLHLKKPQVVENA